MSVRYGDLIIPSEAEVKDSQRQLERGKFWREIQFFFEQLCCVVREILDRLISDLYFPPKLNLEKATTIEIPPTTIPHDFMKLYNNEDLSDITFVVEKNKVPAHKLILAGNVTLKHYFTFFI